MQIDPTFDTEGNELADQIIQERATFAQIRGVLNGMTWVQKIAVAQIACNQLSAAEPVRLVKLEPFEKVADYELRAVAALMRLLPLETLAEIAIVSKGNRAMSEQMENLEKDIQYLYEIKARLCELNKFPPPPGSEFDSDRVMAATTGYEHAELLIRNLRAVQSYLRRG